MHSSGEYITETYKMKPQRDDPQGSGSAITYQRRFALGAFLCLNIDEDDDAEKASTQFKPADREFPEDMREWITRDPFNKTIERYKAGEKDIVDKAINTFKMRRELKEQLLELKNNNH